MFMLLTSLTVSDVLIAGLPSFLVLIIFNDWFNDDNISFDILLISDIAKTEVHKT